MLARWSLFFTVNLLCGSCISVSVGVLDARGPSLLHLPLPSQCPISVLFVCLTHTQFALLLFCVGRPMSRSLHKSCKDTQGNDKIDWKEARDLLFVLLQLSEQGGEICFQAPIKWQLTHYVD